MVNNFAYLDAHTRMLPFADIRKMKTIVIDKVSYFYGLVNGLYHFYPKYNRLYNQKRVDRFYNEFSMTIVDPVECAKDEFGQAYLGFAVTRDSFIYHLPYYMVYVQEVENETKSFYDWLSGE